MRRSPFEQNMLIFVWQTPTNNAINSRKLMMVNTSNSIAGGLLHEKHIVQGFEKVATV